MELAGEIAAALAKRHSIPMHGLTVVRFVRKRIRFKRSFGGRNSPRLGISVEIDRIELARFNRCNPSGAFHCRGGARIAYEGRVVSGGGASSTGLSLEYALKQLRRQRPRWLEAVSLLDRNRPGLSIRRCASGL